MNEIQLVKPSIAFVPCTITYDFAELDTQIKQVEEMMATIELAEDNLPLIKSYMTNLNKLAEALNNDKKDIKKQAAPDLPLFEKECMERVNLIKSIRENMKSFTDEVAERKKTQRREMIETYLNETRKMEVPFSVIWNDEYYKMTDKKWKLDVDYKLGFIESEFNRLDDLALDDIPLLKSLYLKYWNYSQARDAYDDIKATEKKKAELLKETEVQKAMEVQKAQEDINEMPTVESFKTSKPTTETQQTTVTMVTVSGPTDVVEKGIEYLKSIGLKVEVF